MSGDAGAKLESTLSKMRSLVAALQRLKELEAAAVRRAEQEAEAHAVQRQRAEAAEALLEAARAEYAKVAETFRLERDQAVEAAMSECAQALEALRSECSALSNALDTTRRQTEALTLERNQALSESTASQAVLLQLREAREAELRQFQDAHEAEIRQVREAHDVEALQLREAREAAVSELLQLSVANGVLLSEAAANEARMVEIQEEYEQLHTAHSQAKCAMETALQAQEASRKDFIFKTQALESARMENLRQSEEIAALKALQAPLEEAKDRAGEFQALLQQRDEALLSARQEAEVLKRDLTDAIDVRTSLGLELTETQRSLTDRDGQLADAQRKLEGLLDESREFEAEFEKAQDLLELVLGVQ